MTPEGRRLLLEAAAALELDLTPRVEVFGQLLQLLVMAADQVNLTSLRDERDIVLKHFVDSLTCLRGLAGR